MATKKPTTKKPKTKKPKTKTPKADKPDGAPKTRNVKKDTSEIIENALLAFSAARVKVEAVTEDRLFSEPSTSVLSAALKNIREAQSALQGARGIITVMRNTPWREVMLRHLSVWDKDLDGAWQHIIEELDR